MDVVEVRDMTNYEKYFDLPEKAVKAIDDFRGYKTMKNGALNAYSRWISANFDRLHDGMGRNRKMERKTVRKVICHGTHGSKPLFEGDCWTMSAACEACGEHVDPYASECEHCGAIFEGEVNDDEL